jgi:hypothetical protein
MRYHTLDGWSISARWGMSADDRFGPVTRSLLDEALLEICVQMELAEGSVRAAIADEDVVEE